ncbi:MAG: ABC transporter permease [Hyphomicrobiales bacterium]
MNVRAGTATQWAITLLIPVFNLVAALVVSGLVVLIIGENPLEVVQLFVWGAFGYGEGIGYTLFYTTNFIFSGLAFAVAYHAGLFNIGAEGQAYLGGLGVALCCLHLDFLPLVLLIPVAIAAAALFGAAWAFVPGWLQAHRGSHIMTTTPLFNFIAASVMVYLLVNVMAPPGSMQPESATFAESARMPFIHEMLGGLGIELARSPLNMSFLWALVCCVLVWVLIWHTPLGYALRTIGTSPAAAVYAGMAPRRLVVIAMLISGALAGCMALNEIMGSQHRLILEFTSGYGFVGIAVALMGRSHPVGICLAALLFGALYQGGAELAFEKPKITRDMVIVIQGLIIFFAGAMEHLFRPQLEALLTRKAVAPAEEGQAGG